MGMGQTPGNNQGVHPAVQQLLMSLVAPALTTAMGEVNGAAIRKMGIAGTPVGRQLPQAAGSPSPGSFQGGMAERLYAQYIQMGYSPQQAYQMTVQRLQQNPQQGQAATAVMGGPHPVLQAPPNLQNQAQAVGGKPTVPPMAPTKPPSSNYKGDLGQKKPDKKKGKAV